MAQHDPLEILLAHDQWATSQILDACAKLTNEQFHQRFDIGPGSLHDSVTHMLAAMQAWTQILAGQQPGARIDQDGRKRSPAELQTLLEKCTGEFVAEVHRLPLNETATRIREGKTFQFTRGAVLAHVATHGMHHRAQCLNMLRQLGVKPLPPSSVAEWTWMGEGKT
jgi:uncharacterized damage-inducible protein DinB